MKSTLIGKPIVKPEITYPYLGILNSRTGVNVSHACEGTVVLFTNAHTGTVVHSPHGGYPEGHSAENWVVASFEALHGTVELSN